MKEFSRRFDLANRKYLSIFLEVFARIVKVTHFIQVINFRERVHGKIHPRKVDKNNRESKFSSSFFFFFFQRNRKTKFIVPFSTQQQKQKVCCPFLFVAFVFKWALYLCACKGCRSDNKTSKTIRKRKTNILWKIVVFLKEVVFQFFIQKYCTRQNDTFWLFDAALFVQKKKKTRCGRVTLKEGLNNYGLIENTTIILNCCFSQ